MAPEERIEALDMLIFCGRAGLGHPVAEHLHRAGPEVFLDVLEIASMR